MNAPDHSTMLPDGELVPLVTKAAHLDAFVTALSRSGIIPNDNADVAAFHAKFGLLHADVPRHLTRRKLKERVEFLLEELIEFADACGLQIVGQTDGAGNFTSDVGVIESDKADQDLSGQADALVDLVYVAHGTAVMLGLPWKHLWDDVQRANMSKVRGMTKRGHAVDVTKPEGWVGPQTERILAGAGYSRGNYTARHLYNNPIMEELCHDDQ